MDGVDATCEPALMGSDERDREVTGGTHASHDVLLAGIPRSGTTLACELLNLLPETVALDEPMRVSWLTGAARVDEQPGASPAPGSKPAAPLDREQICGEVERFMRLTRRTITDEKTAVSQQVEGRVFGGKWADDYDESGVRTGLAKRGEIKVEKQLSPDFMLVIKHTGAFTALLGTLVKTFPVYAIVRNPLAILSSWETIPFPAREGRHHVVEAIDPALTGELERIDDRLDRELHLLGWFFARYRDFLPGDRVVRYEDLVRSRGTALKAVTARAAALAEPLEDRNVTSVYDRDTMHAVAKRLLDSEGAYWDFYERASVEELLRRAQSAGSSG
jgi:hypothetical protein